VNENNNIYFIFNNKNEKGKKFKKTLKNYLNINIEFNENFTKIIFKENLLNIKKYLKKIY
jgi:hypothetical protein